MTHFNQTRVAPDSDRSIHTCRKDESDPNFVELQAEYLYVDVCRIIESKCLLRRHLNNNNNNIFL